MSLGVIPAPIIQAPMAGVQDAGLAIAAAQAGAVGSLPAAMLGADALARELARLASEAGGPCNVNFFCHAPPAPDPARDAAWRAALRRFYDELGLDPAPAAGAAASRQPFSDALAEVLEANPPAVVSFHFGLPAPALLARVKRLGVAVWSSATTLREALWLQAHGADAVIAQGLQAGGHRGHFLDTDPALQLPTLALLQVLMPALMPTQMPALRLPVIAAGGMVTADDVRAARSLGAAAVQAGTAYLLCPEAQTSAVHRAALQDPAARSALTKLFSGGLARGLENRLMRELGPVNALAPAFPGAAAALAPLRARAEAAGRGDFSPLWAGEAWRACRAMSAAEVTQALAAGL